MAKLPIPSARMFAARSGAALGRAFVTPGSYRAAFAMLRLSAEPVDFMRRYLFESSDYPWDCQLRTPVGTVGTRVYSHHDVLTLNEVFCRVDYPFPAECRVVVDVGANIGLSGLYFLTRHPDVRVHMFEPDPRNVERLRSNLEPWSDRWVTHEEAVGTENAMVSFGRDWGVGRYGAIGLTAGEQIQVRCRHINDVLREVLAVEGRVDLLKIDTEGLEEATVEAIDRELLEQTANIVFETSRPRNPWPERFSMAASWNVCRLSARSRLQA